jgi:hypothetical protein
VFSVSFACITTIFSIHMFLEKSSDKKDRYWCLLNDNFFFYWDQVITYLSNVIWFFPCITIFPCNYSCLCYVLPRYGEEGNLLGLHLLIEYAPWWI